jgi:hypothetical protein
MTLTTAASFIGKAVAPALSMPGSTGNGIQPKRDSETTNPETIHPSVPHRRMRGKSRSLLSMFRKAIVFTSASVGM